MQKNQILQLDIENVGINGEGVARHEGVVVFVKGALPGERVRAKIIGVKKNFSYAILDGDDAFVSEKSKMRVVAPCPVFGKCGGCSIMHVNYARQLEIKRELVRDTLKKVGGIEFDVAPTVASDKELGYRNKMSLPIRSVNGELKIGLFASSSHRVVETADCLLQPKWNAVIISLIRKFMGESGLKAYDEQTGKGDVRHLVVREVEKHLFVTVVATRKIKLDGFKKLLEQNFDSFSLWLNINSRKDNVILGDDWIKIYGAGEIASVEGFKTTIHPAGFFQVNDYIREKIYSLVVKTVEERAPDCVIDAYSGAGIMTAMLSKHCKSVTGIEINEQASQSALNLIKDNGICNMTAICGDVADHIGKVTATYNGKKVTVVLDPPRSGCDKSVLEAISGANVSDVVYVSCSPATLARDLGYLKDYFEIKSITPFDMFPQTMNVENVAWLTRK